MHSTSTPQSLLSLFSTLPQSQMQPELEASPPDDSQGFSSILGTLLPNSAQSLEGVSKLQALPLANQPLPLAEFDLAQLSLVPLEPLDAVVSDNLPLDNLWEQLNFGPIGLVKTATSSQAETDSEQLTLELAEQETELDPLALMATDTETALPPLQPLAQAIAQAHNPDEVEVAAVDTRLLKRTAEPVADTAPTLTAELATADVDAVDSMTAALSAMADANVDAELASSNGQFYMPEPVDVTVPELALTNSRMTAALEPGMMPQPVTNISQFQVQLNTLTETAATIAAQDSSELNADSLQTQLLREKLEFGEDRNQWGAALGTRILTMIADDIQQARIQLDPPELGSLEIKLQIQHDQATVQVQTQNLQVRDVLESHAQRLRDALASQGIALSEFDVSERGAEQQQQQQSETAEGAAGEWLVADEQVRESDIRPASTLNLLDTFA